LPSLSADEFPTRKQEKKARQEDKKWEVKKKKARRDRESERK
jgi:hypothetical protein